MTIASTYRELGLDARAEPHLLAALELRKSAFGVNSVYVAESFDALGRLYRVLGRLPEAEKMVESAWEIYSALQPAATCYMAQTANSLGLIKNRLGKFDEAERWYLEAMRLYEKCLGPDNHQMSLVNNNLAALYSAAGRAGDAEVRYRTSLQFSKKLRGNALHLDTLVAMSGLADILARRGDPSHEAESLFDESYRGMIALYGSNHPRVAQLLIRYANFRTATGQIGDACDMLHRAHRAFRANERWLDLLPTTLQLVPVLLQSGRKPEATALLADDICTVTPHAPPDDLNLAAAHLELGAILLECRRFADAEVHLRCAEASFQQAGDARLARARDLIAQMPVE